MALALVLEERIEVPMDIRSLGDFRRWATSETFPEAGRVDYVAGRIHVDLSPEDLHTHGKLRTELIGRLGRRVKQDQLGELYTARTRVSCPEADLSVEPDVVLSCNVAPAYSVESMSSKFARRSSFVRIGRR